MSLARATATAILVLRVSYGLALVAAPRRLALRWLAAGSALVSVVLAAWVER